ncbi:general secretion pathway protein GspB [Methylobacter marinus]|jgi:general secretion pathway protein B|uniref:general secretion pathway protein GspB n=1 Tax=Methylobacter marinus TaxID=34058 RepID=UPI00037F570B|nr:general secretion pathway protein GspB [Methylobacter marinus]
MSYILNALRKSEQDRQAVEPDKVTNRILAQQPRQPQRATRLIAALIISNLLILAYFLWFTQKPQPDAPTPAGKQPDASAVKPSLAPPVDIRPPPEPEARPPEPKLPSIAEIVEARVIPAKTATAIKKPLTEPVKPAPAPPQPVRLKAGPVEASGPADNAVDKPASLPGKKTGPVMTALEQPASLPAKNHLPFLNELPAEFRRELPSLPINVFVYSPKPAERFVMIDMVKYTPGQRIKDLLELKEIRSDSLIVSYNDRLFKIKRP